jgi:hypothetical protein
MKSYGEVTDNVQEFKEFGNDMQKCQFSPVQFGSSSKENWISVITGFPKHCQLPQIPYVLAWDRNQVSTMSVFKKASNYSHSCLRLGHPHY